MSVDQPKPTTTTLAPAYEQKFEPTYTYEDRRELVDVSGFETSRQVASGNSWEGPSTVGLGVWDHLPGRIVIDIAHDW